MRLFLGFVLACSLILSAVKEKQAKAKPVLGGIKTPGIQIPFANLKAEVELPLDGAPGAFLSAGPNLLVSMPEKGGIARIETKTNKAQDAWTGYDKTCGGIVSAFGNLWAPNCAKKAILKIDSKTGKVSNTLEIGAEAGEMTIAASPDSVWAITDAKGTLSRIDPKENAVVAEIRLAAGCNQLAYEADALWATCPAENRLYRIDTKSNVVKERIEVAAEPIAMAFGEGSLYVLGKKEGKISKLDPKTNKVTATIETMVPGAAGTLAFGEGFLWATQSNFPLTKIDLKTEKIVQQFTGEGGGILRVGGGAIWLGSPAKAQLLRIDPKRVAFTLAE